MKPELVTTRDGARAILDRETGEVMHPIVGPIIEAQKNYLAPSKLADALARRPITLFDVGLGGGSLAIAAWRCAAEIPGAKLEIVSFDRSTEGLALALQHPDDFALAGDVGEAARALLAHRVHRSPHTTWRYVEGELPATLEGKADLIYWDAFSPKRNPELWTIAAFARALAHSNPGCVLHTYSGATPVRAALVLAGWTVGEGAVIGEAQGKPKIGTRAVVPPAPLERPLGARWVERVRRSMALPTDAPPDALERIAALVR